jgi:hypothetical protein
MTVANDWGASGLLPALLWQQYFHAGCWWVVLVWLSTTCLHVGRWPMRVLFFATLWTLPPDCFSSDFVGPGIGLSNAGSLDRELVPCEFVVERIHERFDQVIE